MKNTESKTNFASAQKFASYGLKERANKKRESASGGGSSIKNTQVTQHLIMNTIQKYGIESIIDLGCGDFHWMKEIRYQFPDVSYTGWDASETMVAGMNKVYGNHNTNFEFKDIVDNFYPKVDLAICRDVLFHLQEKYVLRVLDNLRYAGIPYLISTSFLDTKSNVNIKGKHRLGDWGFHTINLNIEPYNLKENVVQCIKEDRLTNSGKQRYICLFDLS